MISIPDAVTVHPTQGAGLGYRTTDGQLILQRRGITNTLEATSPGLGIVVDPRKSGWRSRLFSGGGCAETDHPTLAEAYGWAAQAAGEALGEILSPAPFIAAYMHGWEGGWHLPDLPPLRIVSPVACDPDRGALVTAGDGVIAAHLGADPLLRLASPAGEAAPHIERALRQGIQSVDLERGAAHCHQRLAWLAGSYWLSSVSAPLRCAVLELDMRFPAPVPAP